MCKKTDNGYTNRETEQMVLCIFNDQFLYNNCKNKSIEELQEFFDALPAFLADKYEDDDLELTGSLLHANYLTYCDSNIQKTKNDLIIILFDIVSLWRIDWNEVHANVNTRD